jgi:ATP-dependent Clp protease protease subunit
LKPKTFGRAEYVEQGFRLSAAHEPNYDKKLTVESIDNHIYFYADVDSDRALALIREIKMLDSALRTEHLSRELPEGYPQAPIWLHIYSSGGDAFAAFNIADQIKGIKTPLFSIIEGYCASAGTLISMACARRYIRPRSFMLIHQISSMLWGNFEQLQDEMKLQTMAMEAIINFYKEHSKLQEDQIVTLLKRDSWFNATEAVSLGLVDEILV